MPDPTLLWRRAGAWVRGGILAAVFLLVVLAPTSFVAVEHSSQPEFCNSCHIMEPYFESWERSAHSDVKCIVCHFDPGTMGTITGKFQAISQLAKYVTRTQGTRPWAHVSDQSCLQSGCHSLGALEGPVDFAGVAFDHTPHLLETRGKRLQCVTCHTQMTVEQHFAVEPTICWTCHFMPGPDGEVPERTGGCRVCHGPPREVIDVAGRPFDHAGYVARGVDCRDCHASVVQGTGVVHLQRCRSCHGQPELLAQVGDVDRIHRAHVSEHKVECFECHVEIEHHASRATDVHAAGGSTCSDCHDEPHAAPLLLAAGAGFSIAGSPSRMSETHVTCRACHSGRSAGHARAAGGSVAAAGEVDCLHCHGVGYAGMLAEWQGAVGGGLERLLPLAAELEQRLGSDGRPEARALLEPARRDLALLEQDGSRGVHNPRFALELLRSAAQRIDAAWEEVEPGRAATAAAALPPAVDAACAGCHLDVTQRGPVLVGGKPFDHDRHLRSAGLACSSCHLAEPHGSPGHGLPAFPRAECASCHHTESETLDPSDCARCHAGQQAFFAGTLAEVADAPVHMPDKDCASCHGEPPDILIPPPTMCVLCHEEGYDETFLQWRATTDELCARIASALAAPPAGVETADLDGARRALELVTADGSHGAHNFSLAERLLREALAKLGQD